MFRCDGSVSEKRVQLACELDHGTMIKKNMPSVCEGLASTQLGSVTDPRW